jgi:hypothetical protein
MKLILQSSLLVVVASVATCQAFSVVPRNNHQRQSSITQLNESRFGSIFEQPIKALGSLALSSAIILNTAGVVMTTAPLPAAAESSTVVGSLKGSGLFFKDTLNIERFEDPKVKGVVLYISNFDQPITEKLGGNFFNDPSQSSELAMY